MIDEATIVVIAGKGGDGAVSFRREKFVSRGGPDGGDGGRGGDVVLLADPNENTLGRFRHRKRYQAEMGGRGGRQRRHGANGSALEIPVPVGTMVFTTPADGSEELIADLDRPGARVVVARGGLGGRGNARYATSTMQAPDFAERGLPGDERTLRLELRLMADVGLVGKPSVGKSSLLARVSAARPKIGDYPFTTLEPNLGVVEVGYDAFVLADIPGLIEGAHRGTGLGLLFLRHIQRTRVLCHVLDGSGQEAEGDFREVNDELREFDAGLAARPQIVVVNKLDLPEAAARFSELAARFGALGYEVYGISAATGAGVRELVLALHRRLQEEEKAAVGPGRVEPEGELPVLRPVRAEERPRVRREDSGFVVEYRRAEDLTRMLDVGNPMAREALLRRLKRMGVHAAVRRAGGRPGDRVRIGDLELEWEDM